MKCEIEGDPLSYDAPQNDHRKQRIKRVKGGIEEAEIVRSIFSAFVREAQYEAEITDY